MHGVDPSQGLAQTITAVLSNPSNEKYRWPGNDDFQASWRENKFYGGYRRSRVLMVLQALEEQCQREHAKGEPIVTFDFDSLEIEHVMPQSWEGHWPLPAGETARQERERCLHRIGNLTLVAKALNPTLSNAAWLDNGAKEGKRSGLNYHSLLRLNARLVEAHPTIWDEVTIDARALELFDIALKIWPAPPVTHEASAE